MNHSYRSSLSLAKILVGVFLAAVILTLVFAQWVVFWYAVYRDIIDKAPLLLVSTYAGLLPVGAALLRMRRLLRRVGQGQVFVPDTVRDLRFLSLCCLICGIVCLLSLFYYLSFALVAAAMLFLALVLHILQAVMEQAVAIKTENDYTV